jgi:hypothetical protein
VVVVFHVNAEHALPLEESTAEHGEGLVNRTVDVSIVRTLWTRNGAVQPPATDTTLLVWGWMMKDRKLRPTVARGSVRVEIGHDYVAAWTRWPTTDGGTEWGGIGPKGEAPFDTGIAGQGERLGGTENSFHVSALETIDGKDADQIATILRAAKPDPLAVKYADLPPAERYQAVAKSR